MKYHRERERERERDLDPARKYSLATVLVKVKGKA
jgi:hypothetical protein